MTMKEESQLDPNEISEGVSLKQFETKAKEIHDEILKNKNVKKAPPVDKIELTTTQKALLNCQSPF